MTQKEIQLENLQSLLQGLDTSLLQRAADYVRGLIDASTEQKTDWWDDLSSDEQKDIEIGLNQADKGQFISDQEAMNRFNKWR